MSENRSKKILDFLQYSDGKNDLSEISKIIKVSKKEAYKIYGILKRENLI